MPFSCVPALTLRLLCVALPTVNVAKVMASDLGGRLGRRAARRVPSGSIVPEAAEAAASMTLEGLVRDEVRPLIKEWLDRHLSSV